MKRIAVAVCIAALAVLVPSGTANAATDSPTVSNGFPVRVIWRWHDAHRPGFLGLPIGPPCWGVTVFGVGQTDFDGSSFCTNEVAWRAHPIGTAWEGGFPK